MSVGEAMSVDTGSLENNPGPESERSEGDISLEQRSLSGKSRMTSTTPPAKPRGRPFAPGTSGNPMAVLRARGTR